MIGIHAFIHSSSTASCCQRLEGQLEPVPEDIGRGTKDKERFIPATGLHANV